MASSLKDTNPYNFDCSYEPTVLKDFDVFNFTEIGEVATELFLKLSNISGSHFNFDVQFIRLSDL